MRPPLEFQRTPKVEDKTIKSVRAIQDPSVISIQIGWQKAAINSAKKEEAKGTPRAQFQMVKKGAKERVLEAQNDQNDPPKAQKRGF